MEYTQSIIVFHTYYAINTCSLPFIVAHFFVNKPIAIVVQPVSDFGYRFDARLQARGSETVIIRENCYYSYTLYIHTHFSYFS